MNKKTKILLKLFWLILIVGFLYWFNTTHWIVYKNSEYGFSVSIPENFMIKNDPYSLNNSKHFDFFVVDSEGQNYLGVRGYDKPSDYKEPTGPFPKDISSELSAYTIDSYVLNGISGFRFTGDVEGGGGSFDYFEFLRNGKVWIIEFFAEEGNYSPNTFNEKIYNRIKDSFKVL